VSERPKSSLAEILGAIAWCGLAVFALFAAIWPAIQ
jgi:hypothetical protein